MMWLRRNAFVLLAAVLFAGMIAASLYLLKKARAREVEIQTRYNDLRGQFDDLVRKSIFPSQKNMESLQAQTRQMSDSFQDIYEHLPKENDSFPSMTPWGFIGHLETQLGRLEQYCQANQTVVPTDFSFGFSKYRNTRTPPKQEITPMLLHQLDIIHQIVRLLVGSKVGEIVSIKRTYVEGETESQEDRVEAGLWNKDPKLLYQSQNVEVSFRCTTDQLRAVLNNFASATNILLLVRNVSVQADRAAPPAPETTTTTPGATPAGGSRPTRSAASSLPGMPPGGIPGQTAPNLQPTGRGAGRRGVQAPTGTGPAGPLEVPIVMGNELATVGLRLDVIELNSPEKKEPAPAPGKPGPKGPPRKQA